jgi:hypothetical protein
MEGSSLVWERRLTTPFVFAVSFLLASSFFAPFFFQGQILMGGLDMLNVNYPLLMEARHNFRAGTWGLWNPYLLSGMPSSLIAVEPILRPENWLLFLVPESAMFLTLTAMELLKLGLLGPIAFLLFLRELPSRRWAFLAALVYQLGGYAVWTLATSSLSTLLFFTLSLYWIWSLESRSPARNFVWLTVSLAGLLTSSNLLYDAMGLVTAAALGAWRLRERPGLAKGARPAVALSFIAAVLLTAVRWLPSAAGLAETNRMETLFMVGLDNHAFFAFRLFIPELFGTGAVTSMKILQSLSASLKETQIQVHSHFPHFFGVASMLTLLWALSLRDRARSLRIWLVYVLVVLAWSLELEPLTSFTKWLAHPFFHRLSLHLLLPIGFCFCLLHAASALEKELEKGEGARFPAWPLVIGLVVPVYAVAWTFAFVQHRFFPSPWIKGAVLVLGLSVFLFRRYRPSVRFARLFYPAVAVALAGLVALGLRLKSEDSFLMGQTWALGAGLLALLAGFPWSLGPARRSWAIAACVFLAAVWIPWDRGPYTLPGSKEVAFHFALGIFRYALVLTAFLLLVTRIRRGHWPVRALFPGLVLLTLVELVPAFKVYGDTVMNPFLPFRNPYARTEGEGLDSSFLLDRYRVNYPNLAAGSALYRKLYADTEVLSSFHLVCGIRSYGGYVNAVPARYVRWLKALVPDSELYPNGRVMNGYWSTIEAPRALDLLSVGYDLSREHGAWLPRPGALSRFQFFSSFEVIESEERLLKRLGETSFNPQAKLLLASDPGLASGPPVSEPLSARQVHSDRLELSWTAPQPGLILFNDSFHEGWKAEVNGKPAPVLLANGNFMAIPVSAGKQELVLEFLPTINVVSRWLSVAGLLLLGAAAAGLARRRHPSSLILQPSSLMEG